jgi:VIT1/CCC1 family predicted Fe2+/Mn2+ transporter
MTALTTNQLKDNNLYFYLYMAAPVVFPITFYFTMHEKVAYAALYAVLLFCAVLTNGRWCALELSPKLISWDLR